MDCAPFPTLDAELGGLLQALHRQFQAGDAAGANSTLATLGPSRALDPWTVMGALCVGGAAFAAWLVATQQPNLTGEQCTAIVLDAFEQVLAPPPDARPEHEALVARHLVKGLGLSVAPGDLLNLVRAEFLIDRGPLADLPTAVRGAMDQQQWALSLRGFERIRHELKERTPRGTYGMASMCLHRLGRYEDANQWVRDGLGERQALIATPPVHTEKALLARWGRHTAPVVSILCTAYNHERYIEDTLRGFLSQDCEFPFEILIHDDASTDGTQDVIRRWQKRYPRIIKPVLQTQNQMSRGVRPLETLLARARGGYVATCEGDDYWIAPTKLQRQVAFLRGHADVSCSAHNYYHFVESTLAIKPWRPVRKDFFVSPRQLMAVQFLLWLPTLVFRKSFSTLPPERALAAFGDQFITSYLGTLGRGVYFETMVGAVRRENAFSTWSPLPEAEKERRRVRTWAALVRLHERLGNPQAVDDLMARIHGSALDASTKASILDASSSPTPSTLAAA
ncbi:MAG: glycosyltransferase [Burkholderiaceae bacterium]